MDGFIGERVATKEADRGARRSPLEQIPSFGSNPGALKMFFFAPPATDCSKPRPMVVVLHGCTQTAEGYDRASGWTRLAAQEDFLLVMPQQQAANNSQTCFSWFEPKDTRRDQGEALSIRQMIARGVDLGADPQRIYICGMSAGGAMANAMLALYPDVFAGGAIIAGLPFGTASSVSEAFESMYSGKIRDAKIWGDAVRAAYPHHDGNWPTVSIWHGTADRVVKPINAGELVKQWTNVHRVSEDAPAEDRLGTVTRRIWRDDRNRPRVSEYSIPNMGHGTPVDDADPPAPLFIPAGLSATRQIAEDWGLTGRKETRRSLLSFLGLSR